jgi:hypothetical protein
MFEMSRTIRQLHFAVIDGDSAALEELAARVLLTLRRSLVRQFHAVPLDLINDGIEDAILEYAAKPFRFDESFGLSLEVYLRWAARRNVANSLKAEVRRRRREVEFATEMAARAVQTQTAAEKRADNRGVSSSFRRDVLALSESEYEQAALSTWLSGERRTAPLAALLGLADLPVAEQRRHVKRFKDRYCKRIIRRFSVASQSGADNQ